MELASKQNERTNPTKRKAEKQIKKCVGCCCLLVLLQLLLALFITQPGGKSLLNNFTIIDFEMAFKKTCRPPSLLSSSSDEFRTRMFSVVNYVVAPAGRERGSLSFFFCLQTYSRTCGSISVLILYRSPSSSREARTVRRNAPTKRLSIPCRPRLSTAANGVVLFRPA